MKDEDFRGIMQGLREAGAHARGERVPGLVVHVPPAGDAAAIRKRTGLSQGAFAKAIGVSPGTLKNWEQGRRRPEGPARVLLALLARNPAIVAEMLGGTRRDTGPETATKIATKSRTRPAVRAAATGSSAVLDFDERQARKA
jgi:putative transcriptional regulator